MESLNNFLNQHKLPLALSILGLVLIIGGIFSSNLINGPKKTYPKESLVQNQDFKYIKIDMSGAVNKPGVYSLAQTARVEEAIKASGGFKDSANKEYISKTLNLSAKLSDGQKIYIPYEGESLGAQGGSVAGVNTSGKIGINSASSSQLESLPGVGPATASKIISGRPYSDISELTSRKIITRSVFEKIKEQIDTN